MHSSRRLGLRLACAGLLVQLVGLTGDALLHAGDATLAARERVFSLSSPAHLLIFAGLGLMSVGVVGALGASPWPIWGRWRIGAVSPLPGTLFIALLTLGGTVALGTDGFAATHSHSRGAEAGADHSDNHPHAAATQGHGGSHAKEDDTTLLAQNPSAVLLKQVIEREGTEAALARLEALVAADPSILGQSHTLVHFIGRASFDRYGSAQKAFPHCRQTFESGCYHGVLEAHLKQSNALTERDVAPICEETTGADSTANLRFQCVHGLGHGLSLYFEHDLVRALGYCDFLKSEWDRQSCYGGAFMENTVSAREVIVAGKESTRESELRRFLHREDPHYPCNAVAAKYQSGCYFLQTSAFLILNGSNFTDAFQQCDRAPAQHIWLCYNSLGRDVSSAAQWDTAKAVQLCQLGAPANVPQCYSGVVANLIGVDWTTGRAFELCGRVAESGKPDCYRSIGHQVATLHPADADRVRECAQGEASYHETCLSAARTYSTS